MPPLAPADAFFVHAETRRVPQTVVVLAVADASLTRDALEATVAANLDRLPWLCRRLVTRRLGGPDWEPATPDLARHVLAADLPSPGPAGATAFAAATASRRLPRDRPPWTMTVLPHVAPGRTALVIAVHHALADGPQLIALLGPLLSRRAGDHLHQPGDQRPARPEPATYHPVRQGDRALRGVLLLATDGMVRPGPFTRRSEPGRELAVASVPLSTVRAAARRGGAQPTDVVLSALAGAVATTTARRAPFPNPDRRPPSAAGPVDPDSRTPRRTVPAGRRRARRSVRFAVPVLARSGDVERAGNRTAALWVTVPLDEPDPVARLRAVARDRARVAGSARPAGALAVVHRAGALPAPLHRLFVAAAYRGRFFHGIVSVMPGPRRAVRLGPADLYAVHPVLPLAPRVGLGVGALTWGDTLHLGICTQAGTDPEPLAGAIVAEIEALT